MKRRGVSQPVIGADTPVLGGDHDKLDPTSQKQTILHTQILRACTGALILAALTAGLSVVAGPIVHNEQHKAYNAAAILSTAICSVAAYHYQKLLHIRQSSQLPKDTTEWNMDAVRYCDWLVTLPALVLEIQLLSPKHNTKDAIQNALLPATLMVSMILVGAFARFWFNESIQHWKPANQQRFGFPVYLLSMAIAFGLLSYTLFAPDVLTHDTVSAFVTVPWPLYGVVALTAVFARIAINNSDNPEGMLDHNFEYTQSIALAKDIAFGALDVWSKGMFALWAAAKVLRLYEVDE